ncbi:MAG: ABC transporter substrate-binding protein, partial [Dehalococcoidia bacterium]|nr:ABC transporter substrate-binding protein [Dehalococcoidia bacterium]
WFRLASIVAVAAAVLVLLAACGGEGKKAENTPTGSATSEAKVAELQDGVLQVGSDISYAPIEFFEEGTQNAAGLDVDLANALAEELGVRAEFINTGFDGIIGALNVSRFDVLISAMTVTEERQKEIDFIPYFAAGTDILVAEGNPKNIKTIEDLSGLTVGVQIGTIQVDQLKAANDTLKAAGKPEISVLTFDQNPLAVEQLRTGRADAVIADSPVVANEARLSDGKLEALGLAIEAAPYGIGVRKESTQLKAAIEGALQKLIANGKYKAILIEWGLEGGAID